LELQPIDPTKNSAPRPRLAIVVVTLSVLVIMLFIWLPPATLLGKADLIGYGICHRIPERSFVLGDRQFPLCARCTGTFLGAIVGLTAMILLGRRRAARMPPISVLGVLVVFVSLWGFDGLNSYMTFFPNGPHLYEPRNWLRLTTGLLNGLALVTFVLPIFNFTVWREPMPERVFKNLWELAALLPVVALLVVAVQSGVDLVLYPLALVSSLGVLVMLVLIDSMIAAVVLGREGYAKTWLQALVPLTVGTALAIVQITAMASLRVYLTTKLGLPF
jgi:uncharacterized membrane protein